MRRSGAIDGIRAIAVVTVLLYHYFPLAVPGGFLGVDVFFVLSGFLITSLLLRERVTTGTISLTGFWGRRARRILPAALTVAGVTTAVSLFVDPDLRVGLGRQLLGICTFSTNWVQVWAADSYFAHTNPQLFVHYWSLAVEEQFYLVWPLLVVAVLAVTRRCSARVSRMAAGTVAAAGALASAVAMAVGYEPGQDPSRLYYGTDTHCFGLLIGALAAVVCTSTSVSRLAAVWPTWRRGRGRARIEATAALVSLAVVLVAVFGMGDTGATAYRGGIAAVCVAAAVLIVAAARGDGPVRAVLDRAELRWVGVRSYSIYLVHWPVFLIVDSLLTNPQQRASGLVPVLAITLTVLLGAACRRWVEVPFLHARPGMAPDERRRGALRHLRPALPWTAGIALACVAIGAVVSAPAQTSTEQQLDQLAAMQRQSALAPPPPPPPAHRSMPPANQITVIGDSVALGATEAFLNAFPGMPPDNIDAQVSRSWLAVPSIVSARQASGGIGQVVILGIGANGPAGAEYVRAVLDQLGPGVLVIVVNAHSNLPNMTDINTGIDEAARGRPNVEVADWNSAITPHTDLLAGDEVHPSDERGRELYVSVVRQALDRLLARTPAGPDDAAAQDPAGAPAAGGPSSAASTSPTP